MNDKLKEYVDSKNALAIVQNLDDLRERVGEFEELVQSLKQEIGKMREQSRQQTKVLSEALQRLAGSGSTEGG